MLKYEDAKEVMNKYYYGVNTSSLTLCDFRNQTSLVIRYNDSSFGNIRRIVFFDDIESFETFLDKFKWYEANKNYCDINILDYEDLFPNIYFSIDGKVVFDKDITNYEVKDVYSKKEVLDFLIKYYYECKRKNEVIYDKYNFLVDYYNDCIDLLCKEIGKKRLPNKLERISKKKINDSKVKDILNNKAINNNLILELINICYGLELNESYYELLLKYKKATNDLSLLLAYEAYIESLNGWKINSKELKDIENKYYVEDSVYSSFIEDSLDLVKNKYNYANKMGIKKIVCFLEEAFCNDDYQGIAERINNRKVKIGKNALFIDLEKQYNSCSKEEKQLATLYNTKYRGLFNHILDGSVIHEYNIKKLYKYIDEIEEVSRMKEECFDLIKDRIELDNNRDIKNDYFYNIVFSDYKEFLQSLVMILVSLNTICKKMVLNENITLFYRFNNDEMLSDKLMCYLMDNPSTLIETIKEDGGVLGRFRLKEGLPVVYSPYTIDLGVLYDEKNMDIEVTNNNSLDLAINIKDVNIDEDYRFNRVNYYDIIYDNSNGINVIKSILLNSSIRYEDYYVWNKKEV